MKLFSLIGIGTDSYFCLIYQFWTRFFMGILTFQILLFTIWATCTSHRLFVDILMMAVYLFHMLPWILMGSLLIFRFIVICWWVNWLLFITIMKREFTLPLRMKKLINLIKFIFIPNRIFFSFFHYFFLSFKNSNKYYTLFDPLLVL
jgi:hypothetical protein